MQTELQQNYAFYRARHHTAIHALTTARIGLANGKRRYGACNPAVVYNPISKTDNRCKHVRWIENAADGMRLVGFADELNRSIRHTGYYILEDLDGAPACRGVVYQLPARGGCSRFVYGYADPNNDGAALLCFDPCNDKDDAAHWADSFAERQAEQERDYQAAWSAGNRYSMLGDDLARDRADLRETIKELRAEHKTYSAKVCSIILEYAHEKLAALNEYRQERASLRNGEGIGRDCHWSWNSYAKDLREAFNEGAGCAAIKV